MAISFEGVAVGAMERGSEIIREETKKAEDLVDNSIKMWTEMGLPVFRARKKQRRELETVADFLSNKGFSNDQISEAMRQGKHTAVVDHVTAMEKMGQGYNAADIITFADANYQDTGRTMDQVLDGVMGKVKKGMSLTDAIADSTGKNIGGIQGAIMKRRAGAVKTAFGIDPTEFRSLAREDFEYGDNLGGEITLTDPVAAAKAAKAMEGKTTGMTNVETTRDAMFDFGADLVGGKEQVTSSGIIYSFEQPGRRVELNKEISRLVTAKEKEVGRSTFNAADRDDIQNQLYGWAVSNEYYTPPAQQAEAEVTAAASALDTIKAGMRTDTSWMERGQTRQNLVNKLSVALKKAGTPDDDVTSEAYAILLSIENQIKTERARAAEAGSNPDVNSDFSGGSVIVFREYNQKDELTKEELLADKDFVNDASTFLSERGGIKKPMSPEETYDAFMEHMRFHNVNEVTTIRDLEYAQNSNLEGKLRFGNLIDAYDKLDGEVSLTSALDYAEGIATAPSTYLGLISAGTGKAAAVAGTQAAKIGVRKILSEALKGSAKAAAVEGSIGFGQGLAQEGVLVETGRMPEMTGDLAGKMGLLSAAGAGIINFPVAAMQSKRASRANELYESAQLNQAKKATQASEKSKEVLKAAPKAEANKIKSELKALDADKVKKGRQIKQQSSTSETLEASIPPETIENIAAAGLRVRELLKMKKGERITSVMQRMLSDNKLPDADIQKILDEHNLTYDEFSLMYLAEVSDAGRVLGAQGRLSQALTPQARRAKKNQVDDMMDSLDKLNKGGKSSIDSTTAKKLAENRNGVGGFFKDLDRARLGVMTSQPATTMRNNLNAGFRIAVDMSTRAFDNALNLRNPFDGTLDIVNYTLNPYEAQVIKKMFTESFPVEAGRLFREAADLEARSGSEGALATLGRKVNVLNTMSDNLWKKSVLSASLKRRLSDAGIEMTEEARNTLLRNRLLRQMDEASADQVLKTAKGDDLQKLYGEYGLLKKNMDLYDFIETGQLKKLPQDILKDSIEDAYSFVYQTSMKGDNLFGGMAKAVIKGHQDYPMLISSVLPFPRYIANQLKFVYEHAPLIGLMPLDRIGSKAPARSFKEYMQEKLPKQMTGALMMTAAYNWRAKQGDTEYWYEFKDNNGNVIDGRAVYGPFAPFMLAADLIYRHQRGTMPVSIHSYARDTLQALAGSTFRVGLGLYTLDKLYTDVESGAGQKVIAEGVANIINTFTIPASAARDLYAQFDKDARGIPETRTGSMNFYDILYQRATRSLPKNFASDAEEDGFLGFGDAAERATSPFQTGELMQINPLEKQIFGFSKRPAKNSLQNEMGRLNMQPYDLYKRDPNEKRDLYVRQELSKEDGPLNLNDRMSRIIASDAYQRFGDDADGLSIKRDVFDTEVKRIIQEARNIADAKIEKDAFDVNAKYTDSDQVEWMRMNKLLKGRIDAEYRKVFGGESVSADRDKTVTIDNKEINVLRWALSRASQVRGKGGGL